MARIRTIKPEFPQSESMGKCSRDARLTFLLLFTMADDCGRLRANSRMLASLLFPYDDDAKKHIDTWLTELENVSCIQRYLVDGDSYIAINKWTSHQKIDKPTPSKLPSPEEDSRMLASSREYSFTTADSPSAEGKGREGKGMDSAEPQSDSTPESFVITIPLVDQTEFGITEKHIDEWSESFPAVDVNQQLRSMRQWCLANPTRRKTKRGVSAFIVSWLTKEQDKGRTFAKPVTSGMVQGAI